MSLPVRLRGLGLRPFQFIAPVAFVAMLQRSIPVMLNRKTPDGTTLLLTSFSAETREDVGMVRVDGNQTYEPLLDDELRAAAASVLPDGCWLVYESNPSGRVEVYVRPGWLRGKTLRTLVDD